MNNYPGAGPQGFQGYSHNGGPSATAPQAGNNGYTPVEYGSDGSDFWGNLLDYQNRPTPVFCRLVDSLFFLMDQNADQHRGTQHIEPTKYLWLWLRLGVLNENQIAAVDLGDLQNFYDLGSIPYVMGDIGTTGGKQVPVLDRRGFLHLCVYEARASPEDTHKHWTKVLATFGLVDPQTQQPFPLPLPRASFPMYADAGLVFGYKRFWSTFITNVIIRSRTNAYAGVGAAGLGTSSFMQQYQASQAQTAQILQNYQAQQRRASLVGGAVKLAGNLLNGGLGGGFGGGLGGGTGFGF
ncbi:hypothetical protein SISSUDRAFT_1047112 [Sistotremastrum suecicum HHB10207 ss-3]|uniref:DUF7514 domain-containing protein n=1 Tax=Sistotremastrum suecicum HHB10207 ss-3 TaxID=1314776 RepID=A0A166DDV6_9AGAM|nr:hypothetical protein SISSUDRAFT_1047112 [Sistotremastrum suecicum HHB10207 ss-3]